MVTMVSQVASAAPGGFSFRSGRLCLDFAATLMFRGTRQPRELLDSPATLDAWVLASGAVSLPTSCHRSELALASELREAIYRLCVTRIAGHQASRDDLAVLNRHGQHAPVALVLNPDQTLTRRGTMGAALASVGRDAIELLGGPDALRLRQCGREGCTRMFIDGSRGGNRTWCGMRECGNRVNAAAYRRRKHRR